MDEPVSDSCPLVGSECESLATSEVSRLLVSYLVSYSSKLANILA